MSLYEDDDDVSGSDADLPSGDDDDGTLEDAAAAEEEHADEGEQSGSSDEEEGQQGGSAQRKSSRGRKQQEREALVLPGGAAAEGAEQLMVPGNADTALLQLEVRTLLARARSFSMQAVGCMRSKHGSSRQSADCLGRLHSCTGGCAAG